MKLKEFQRELAKKRIGLALFFSLDASEPDPNVVYFSQYHGFGALAVTPKKAVLIVPLMERGRARTTKGIKVIATKDRLIKTIKRNVGRRFSRVGIDKNRVSVNFYKVLKKEIKASYVDVARSCLVLRATKTPEEIKIIRHACRITDEIMHKTLWNFKRFRTESDVSAFMINEVNRLGLKTSFSPVVGSGAGASEAHHSPENRKLRKGFCVIDFGVKYKGYCSDITRTIYLGSPSRTEIELYHKVLEVQSKLIMLCRPGKSFILIDKKAHEFFGKDSRHFTHLIGHGVGVEIHENPNPKKTPARPVTKLAENSIITIEPGIYFPKKLGIRIEDDILVTEKGPEILTKTGKNLLVVKVTSP